MRVLGVHPYAPDEVIKAAYRALVAKYHSGSDRGVSAHHAVLTDDRARIEQALREAGEHMARMPPSPGARAEDAAGILPTRVGVLRRWSKSRVTPDRAGIVPAPPDSSTGALRLSPLTSRC